MPSSPPSVLGAPLTLERPRSSSIWMRVSSGVRNATAVSASMVCPRPTIFTPRSNRMYLSARKNPAVPASMSAPPSPFSSGAVRMTTLSSSERTSRALSYVRPTEVPLIRPRSN